MLPRTLILDIQSFYSKIETLPKLKKKERFLRVSGLKTKKNIESMDQKKCCQEKHVDFLLIDKKGNKHVLLSEVSIHLCIIILYTIEKYFYCYCLQAFSIK